MDYKIYVDKDICKAETLPAKFYKDQEIFELVRKKIFLKCWHWIGDESLTENKNSVYQNTQRSTSLALDAPSYPHKKE